MSAFVTGMEHSTIVEGQRPGTVHIMEGMCSRLGFFVRNIYIYIYIYIYKYIQIHIHVHLHVHIHFQIHVPLHVRVRVCLCFFLLCGAVGGGVGWSVVGCCVMWCDVNGAKVAEQIV